MVHALRAVALELKGNTHWGIDDEILAHVVLFANAHHIAIGVHAAREKAVFARVHAFANERARSAGGCTACPWAP